MSISADIPTPEADAAHTFQEQIITCKSLERRLTVAREALAKIVNSCLNIEQAENIAEKALTLTAPRP